MKLILIEGVPGSGKSTLAETLYKEALSRGISASWYLEEDKKHPVHPHIDRAGKNLAEYYLCQWGRFVSANIERNHLFILEGSLFQSTVRFMIEAGHEQVIPEYFTQCQNLLSRISSEFIYLRPIDIHSHIDWISAIRGEDWTGKVTQYLENTPFCRARGWSGNNGMHEFWSYYADCCDLLVNRAVISNQTIVSGQGHFESQLRSALSYTQLN